MADSILFHGTAVLVRGTGVLFRAPSGGGKSDLALRVIESGGRLIGDDYLWLRAENGSLYAMAPATIKGRIEVRGIGIVAVPTTPVARIHAIVDLVDDAQIERMPEVSRASVAGLEIPHYRIDPFKTAAVAKVMTIAELCRVSRGLPSNRLGG